MSSIPVLEIFGPTIQGEGMVVGQKTMFVRTAGCDYRCRWCDSAFTWDGSAQDQIRQMTPEDIYDELLRLGQDRFCHVTISGGNPALIRSIGELVDLLHTHGIRTAIETQGTKWQDWLLSIDEVTLSPKPPSSGMTTDFAELDAIVGKLTSNPLANPFSLKVVVFDEQDFAYAQQVHKRYPRVPFFLQTGNEHVQLTDDAQLLKNLLAKFEWLIEQTVAAPDMNDVKVLPQLHALLWGNKRGV